MLLAGDEVLRTQRAATTPTARTTRPPGWTGADGNESGHAALLPGMIALRKRHPLPAAPALSQGPGASDGRPPEVSWHGVKLNKPSWFDPAGPVPGLYAGSGGAGRGVTCTSSSTYRSRPSPLISECNRAHLAPRRRYRPGFARGYTRSRPLSPLWLPRPSCRAPHRRGPGGEGDLSGVLPCAIPNVRSGFPQTPLRGDHYDHAATVS
jgi:hypothetical protein